MQSRKSIKINPSFHFKYTGQSVNSYPQTLLGIELCYEDQSAKNEGILLKTFLIGW